MSKIIDIDTRKYTISNSCNSLYENRSIYSSISDKEYNSDVTICIQGYNKIEKTKRCVESVLKYTSGIDFDMILIDNGSNDGTYEYFMSIDFEKKTIMRFTKNCGALMPQFHLGYNFFSRYVVFLADDMVVTANWLENMLKIADSDDRIGLVNPVSSNVSNCQEVNFKFTNYEEMQNIVSEYNKSNPRKWHERLRIVTLGAMYRKECLFAIGLPISDFGFAHNFSDDDITFRIRRAGYKAILAQDTWIHHDDDKSTLSAEKVKKMNYDLSVGRENFREKYMGIDAWDDVNNYIPEVLEKITPPIDNSNCAILGIDVKCGTPILEIKNHLRNYDIYNPECCAITSEGKYFIDLQTVCGAENVVACAPDNAYSNFSNNSFDYIIIGNSINEYPEPIKIIRQVYSLLKKNGQMFVYLKNTFNVYAFLNIIGYHNIIPSTVSYNMTPENLLSLLSNLEINAKVVDFLPDTNIPEEYINEINNKLDVFEKRDWETTKNRLICDKYLILIEK